MKFPARFGYADDVITSQLEKRHIPGLAIAIIQNGKIVREQGYGYTDKTGKRPVTPSTLFQAASISKSIAALGALHLVDQGQVALDEEINSKLKSWFVPQNKFTKEHAVTLREILNHTAGLTLNGPPGYDIGAPIPSLLQMLDGKPPANTPAIRVIQVPGSRWRYSGGGYLVMQQMLTDVTGTPFAQYVGRTVLKPLGMVSSTYAQPLPDALADRAATGYSGVFGRSINGRWRVHPELAAAGLWTVPGDLARFAIGIQRSLAGDSNPVISKATTRLMLTGHRNDDGLGLFVDGIEKKMRDAANAYPLFAPHFP